MNISLPDDIKEALSFVAKRDKMPAATKAERLIEIALELEEDRVWDSIASKRDNDVATFFSHDQVFKS
jgi:hypothetical protein